MLLKNNPVIWKERVTLVVGAASSRDHLFRGREPLPQFFLVTWTLRISAKKIIEGSA